MAFESGVSRFDMTWNVIQRESRLLFGVEYCTDLFGRVSIEQFAALFKRMAALVTADPDILLREIELISPSAKRKILCDFNDSAAVFPTGQTIQQLFVQQVNRKPDRAACLGADSVLLSYRELNRRSDRLAGLAITTTSKTDTAISPA